MPNKKVLKCPVMNCVEDFVSHNSLRYHIIEFHKIKLKEENLIFESAIDFMVWKQKVQVKEKSTYVQETGSWSLKGGSQRICYICHRSLTSKSRVVDENRKRSIKAAGSNKIGKACPAIMSVTVVGTKVKVKYVSTHVGHDCEISRQPISEPDRRRIAGKLAKGIPVTRILDDVRESSKSSTLQRIDLIGKRDILNIKRDYIAKSSNSDSTGLCFLSSKLSSESVNNDNDDIKSMIKAMIKLTKKSVLDSYKKELLKDILTQGMDVLFDGISNTDQLTT